MKPALILVPGLLSDETFWAAQTASLAPVAHVQVAVHSDLDSLGALAEAIIARSPPRFAIAGHSMGGRIALEVARRVPERLSGLALLNSGYAALPSGEAGERETARRHALLELARRAGMRAMARAWVQDMIYAPRLAEEGLVSRIVDMFARQTPERLALQIHALLTRPDARSVLSGLSCPALVVCGHDDGSAPPALHGEMASLLPHASLTVIPHCGHMAPLERPAAVDEALQVWLEAATRQ